MRIGFIGTGTIASAVVRAIANDGHLITISERSKAFSSALASEFSSVSVADNQMVLDQSEVVFIGLIASTAKDILRGLSFRDGQRVISFMAGVALEDVATMVAPADASAVMLPFPTIANGGSAILALGATELVQAIFGERNRVFALKDAKELDAYLCAQAILSPIARMVSDTAHWLGNRIEDGEAGEEFLRVLVASSLGQSRADDLIAALNTEGGYNQRLRLHLEQSGQSLDTLRGLDGLEQGTLA